jgi:MYXO-CTERM domain-containing protein
MFGRVGALVVVVVTLSCAIASAEPLSVTQQAELLASDGAANDYFGFSVSVSGETAVVGVYGKNSETGAAYVFVRSGATWTQQAKLLAADGSAGDSFGRSVSVAGDTAVVGAPGRDSLTGGAYVFVRSGTAWSQQATLLASDGAAGDYVGRSVSVAGDTTVVGAPGRDSLTGGAYVFVRIGTTWSQQAKLLASDVAAYDQFGVSVSVSADTAVVGANAKNSFTGAAYAFVRSGTAWSQQATLLASDGVTLDSFGWSVSVSADTAVVGGWQKDSYTGAAYIFVRSGTAWSQQATLLASDAAQWDDFGWSVSVSGDTAVVGAPGRDFMTGAAYTFVRSGTAWPQQATLRAGDAAAHDNFGLSVSVLGDTAVVGAYERNSFAGAAYVFIITDGGTAQQDGGAAQQDGGAAQHDGGTAQRDGGAAQRDVGAAQHDGGAVQQDGGSGNRDAGLSGEDGGVEGLRSRGCGCRANGDHASTWLLPLGLALVLTCHRRRRRG